MSTDPESRLLQAYRRLEARERASLLDFAEFLAARVRQPGAVPQPAPRPAEETVIQAIRRLSRGHPGPGRHALMPVAERLLAQHMVEDRPAAEIIDELERHYAAHIAAKAAPGS